tara:strand:- start:21 stop:800 length:780 start_codon:yes stop_codon:yes gene_type:complete
MSGWISLHRKILRNPTLTRGRVYSRFEAFIWLLLKANHQQAKVVIGNKIIQVKRGSFVTSQKKLMQEFNWGSTKLRANLKLWEDDGMIRVNATSTSTMVSICNYGSYQNLQTDDKPQSNRKQTESKPKAKTNNNNINKEEQFINKAVAVAMSITPNPHPDIVNEFCDYWTEKNEGGRLMKFQMMKTFDISRRLKKWLKNQRDWNIKPKTKYQYEDFKFDSSGYNKIAYCEKCNISDFYKKPQIEDSKCCGTALIPKRRI